MLKGAMQVSHLSRYSASRSRVEPINRRLQPAACRGDLCSSAGLCDRDRAKA